MADLSLLQDFVTETTEHLEEMEKCLLALEGGTAEPETFNGIFRSVHTIKGSAEYLGLDDVAELSHRLENLLDFMRQGKKAAEPDIIELLIAAHDRIGFLVQGLDQQEAATVEIDDLLAQIEAACPVSGSEDKPAPEPQEDRGTAGDGPNEAPAAAAAAECYEEHYDQELFSIFLVQLKDSLEELRAEGRRLPETETPAEILDRCLEKVEMLRSAANYMGYERALAVYGGWSEALRQTREKCLKGAAVNWDHFYETGIEGPAGILEALFPLAETDGNPDESSGMSPDLDVEEIESLMDNILGEDDSTDPGAEAAESAAGPEPEDDFAPAPVGPDLSLIDDFVSETHEQLQELEQQMVRMAAAGDDPETLNAVFRSVHTIKGAAEYVGVKGIAELSHRLESLLEMVRQMPEKTTPGLVDTLIAARDRIAELVQDLAETGRENRSTEDILARIEAAGADPAATPPADPEARPLPPAGTGTDGGNPVYVEEYDAELFTIFLDQFNEGLEKLRSEAAAVAAAPPGSRSVQGCLDTLASLSGSANYMGYTHAVRVYEQMTAQFEQLAATLGQGEDVDWDRFVQAAVEDGIRQVRSLFPEPGKRPAAPAAAPGAEPEAAEDASASGALAEEAGGPATPDEDILVQRLESAFDEMTRSFGRNADTAEVEGFSEALFTLDDRSHGPTDTNPVSVSQENDADDVSRGFDALFSTGETIRAGEQPALDPAAEPSGAAAEERRERQPAPEPADSETDGEAADAAPGFTAPAAEDVEPALPDPPAGSAPALEGFSGAGAGEEPPPDQTPPAPAGDGDRPSPDRPGRRSTDRFAEKMLKQSIRVDAKKIDALINQVGELVVNRAYFSQLYHDMKILQQHLQQQVGLEQKEMKQVKAFTFKLSEATVALGRAANDLQEGVMRIRMLPIAQLFNRYPRLVHDLVKGSGKKVNLDIRGEDTELDKMIIEEISDPMIHIIRNAVDHGIEGIEERRAAGKPETGTLKLEAYHESNHVVVEISDDGRGIDVERVKASALEKELHSREELDRMTSREITGLVMKPGFSTAERVTHTSGRGVGMDVVKKNIEKLNGTLEVESDAGLGTRIRLKIPLTLAIIPALLVEVGGDLFTIPLSTVDETLRIDTGELTTIEGVEVLEYRNGTLPVVQLTEMFNMVEPDPGRRRHFVVVVSSGLKRIGIVVDRLIGQEEVVIKPLEDYLQENSGFSGATILGDGRISLILDIYELINLSIEKQARRHNAVAMG